MTRKIEELEEELRLQKEISRKQLRLKELQTEV